MHDGLIRVATASPAIQLADCRTNAEELIQTIEKAYTEGVSVLTFPELCVTGSTCGDLFYQPTLINGALDALAKIAEATRGKELLVFVGAPILYAQKLYSCAVAIFDGVILGVVPKRELTAPWETCVFATAPTENSRIELLGRSVPFGTGLLFACRNVPGLILAAELSADLWSPIPPSTAAAQAGATVICNLAATAETVGLAEYRRLLVKSQSAKLACAYLLADANPGESTTDMVFASHTLIAENGVILAESKPFGSGVSMTEIDVDYLLNERRKNPTSASVSAGFETIGFDLPLRETKISREFAREPFIPAADERVRRCEEILAIQAHGLARRTKHAWAKSLVIGISGGLDSCLALLVAVRAMKLLGRPMSEITAITMPCFGTTARTKNNALTMCELLGVTTKTIQIGDAVTQHFADIGHDPQNHNVVFENAQARERTQVLMDIANAENGLVVGTGDLSELALGWATYNGDHMSMYGVNAAVPKTLVRYLVAHEADMAADPALAAVLRDILATPVSPELLPASDAGDIAQKTEELVGPYLLHDFYLFYCIRRGYSPRKVLRLAETVFAGEFDRKVLLYWLKNFYRRFFIQQFKRSCLPDGPKVGSVSLSPRGDWHMPSDASSKLWMAELETLE
ncbi:MAG: NAD(+) synthase [Clostridia bacterium]|nr:NAD(+) synthase [Clostridia bacterium]